MIYTKPARHSHKNTSMDVLVEVPQDILDEVPSGMEQVFAEELVSALNCCRKYRKGLLVVHMDADLQETVCIKYKGEVRTFKALQAMNKWLNVDAVFALLGDMSGLPRACRTIEYLEATNNPF